MRNINVLTALFLLCFLSLVIPSSYAAPLNDQNSPRNITFTEGTGINNASRIAFSDNTFATSWSTYVTTTVLTTYQSLVHANFTSLFAGISSVNATAVSASSAASAAQTTANGALTGVGTVNTTAVNAASAASAAQTTANGALIGVGTVNTTATGAVTVNNGQYTNITILQAASAAANTTYQQLAANISAVNNSAGVNSGLYTNVTILQAASSAQNTTNQQLAANISSVNTSQNTVNAAQYTNITILQSAESRTNTSLTSINATAVAGLGTGLSGLSANQLLVAASATNLTIANISVTSNGTGISDYTIMTFNGNRSNLGYQNNYLILRAGSGKFVGIYAEDTLVYNATQLGTRIYGMLNVSGNLNASNFTGGSVNTPTVCINGDCRSAWPAAGGGNTTAEVQAAAYTASFYTNVSILQTASSAANTTYQQLAANISSLNSTKGNLSGAGTTNVYPIFTGTGTLGNSTLRQSSGTTYLGQVSGGATLIFETNSTSQYGKLNCFATNTPGVSRCDFDIFSTDDNSSTFLMFRNMNSSGLTALEIGKANGLTGYNHRLAANNVSILDALSYGLAIAQATIPAGFEVQVNGSLNASSLNATSVRGNTVCIGTDCRTAFPEFGANISSINASLVGGANVSGAYAAQGFSRLANGSYVAYGVAAQELAYLDTINVTRNSNGSVNLSLSTAYRLPSGCTNGQRPNYVSANASWTCADDASGGSGNINDTSVRLTNLSITSGTNAIWVSTVSDIPYNGQAGTTLNNFNAIVGLRMDRTGTGTSDYIQLRNSTNATDFVVDSSGQVGIGDSTPDADIDVRTVQVSSLLSCTKVYTGAGGDLLCGQDNDTGGGGSGFSFFGTPTPGYLYPAYNSTALDASSNTVYSDGFGITVYGDATYRPAAAAPMAFGDNGGGLNRFDIYSLNTTVGLLVSGGNSSNNFYMNYTNFKAGTMNFSTFNASFDTSVGTPQLCLNGVCRTSWPAAGGGNTTAEVQAAAYTAATYTNVTILQSASSSANTTYQQLAANISSVNSSLLARFASTYTNVTILQAADSGFNTSVQGLAANISSVNSTLGGAITGLQSGATSINTSLQQLAANITSVNSTVTTVNNGQYTNITILQSADSGFNTSIQGLAANISSVNSTVTSVNNGQFTNITILQTASASANTTYQQLAANTTSVNSSVAALSTFAQTKAATGSQTCTGTDKLSAIIITNSSFSATCSADQNSGGPGGSGLLFTGSAQNGYVAPTFNDTHLNGTVRSLYVDDTGATFTGAFNIRTALDRGSAFWGDYGGGANRLDLMMANSSVSMLIGSQTDPGYQLNDFKVDANTITLDANTTVSSANSLTVTNLCIGGSCTKSLTNTTRYILGATSNTTALTYSYVPQLNWSMASGRNYSIECNLYLQTAAATTGANITFSSNSTPTFYRANMIAPTSATAVANARNVTLNGSLVTTGVTSTAFQEILKVDAYVRPSAYSQMYMMQATEISGSASALLEGSYCMVTT